MKDIIAILVFILVFLLAFFIIIPLFRGNVEWQADHKRMISREYNAVCAKHGVVCKTNRDPSAHILK